MRLQALSSQTLLRAPSQGFAHSALYQGERGRKWAIAEGARHQTPRTQKALCGVVLPLPQSHLSVLSTSFLAWPTLTGLDACHCSCQGSPSPCPLLPIPCLLPPAYFPMPLSSCPPLFPCPLTIPYSLPPPAPCLGESQNVRTGGNSEAIWCQVFLDGQTESWRGGETGQQGVLAW